jgi:hypothetical protein
MFKPNLFVVKELAMVEVWMARSGGRVRVWFQVDEYVCGLIGMTAQQRQAML